MSVIIARKASHRVYVCKTNFLFGLRATMPSACKFNFSPNHDYKDDQRPKKIIFGSNCKQDLLGATSKIKSNDAKLLRKKCSYFDVFQCLVRCETLAPFVNGLPRSPEPPPKLARIIGSVCHKNFKTNDNLRSKCGKKQQGEMFKTVLMRFML